MGSHLEIESLQMLLVKDSKMSSSWVREGPASNDRYPSKRQKRRHRYKGEGRVEMEAETGAMRPEAQGCLEPPEAGKGRKEPPLEPLEDHTEHSVL